MGQIGRRRPSAALVVAIIALVVAASGTALATGRLVSGDSLIRKHSLSGNRLRTSLDALARTHGDAPILAYSAKTGAGRSELWREIHERVRE